MTLSGPPNYGRVWEDNKEKVHVFNSNEKCFREDHIDTICGLHSNIMEVLESENVDCPKCISQVLKEINSKTPDKIGVSK